MLDAIRRFQRAILLAEIRRRRARCAEEYKNKLPLMALRKGQSLDEVKAEMRAALQARGIKPRYYLRPTPNGSMPVRHQDWFREIRIAFSEALSELHDVGLLGPDANESVVHLMILAAEYAVCLRGGAKHHLAKIHRMGPREFARRAGSDMDRFQDNPPLVFGAVYLISHVEMGLLEAEKVSGILDALDSEFAKIAPKGLRRRRNRPPPESARPRLSP